METPPNYQEYLQLQPLLDLQGGLERDEERLAPGELHFIIVHQCHELWFKLLLRELRQVGTGLADPAGDAALPRLGHLLRRAVGVLRLLVQTMAVMEELTPQEFLLFRDRLAPASGFQSVQWRELEHLLEGPLQAAVQSWLDRRATPDELAAGRDAPERRQAQVRGIMGQRETPGGALPAQLVQHLVELDEQVVLWRHRHARVAERLIGSRTGTGGSTGVEYLDRTTDKRSFPELWTTT